MPASSALFELTLPDVSPFGNQAASPTFIVVLLWAALREKIAPHYPKAGNGRPPIGLERMLRIHFIQQWFNLADLAGEEALYDSVSLRRFVGIDLGCEPVPDATTMLRFRRLLNDNKLGETLEDWLAFLVDLKAEPSGIC